MKKQYYRHKQKPTVICEVWKDCKEARFGKWVWKGNICTEIYTYKPITENFTEAFENITQKQFNNTWGNKLQIA